MRIGFVALTDAAPLLVARALGLFERQEVSVELACEPGWATIREKLVYGELQGAHAPAGTGLALQLGHRCVPLDVCTAFVFNLHGNAITLSGKLRLQGVTGLKELRSLALTTSGDPLVFACVSESSSHRFLLREWLQSGGIQPGRDVQVVVLPPSQMPAALREGLIDGYCVGEPWNSVALLESSAWCPVTSETLSPGHPEKIFLVTSEFARLQSAAHAGIVRALDEACRFCHDPANGSEVVRILVESRCFRCPEAALSHSFVGPFDRRDGSEPIRRFHVFSGPGVNCPDRAKALWVIDRMIRHGMVPIEREAEVGAAATRLFRPDLYKRFIPSAPAPISASARAKTSVPRRSAKTAPATAIH